MGRIFCIMGKSASGKDTVYREILKRQPELGTYVMYTTRPIREGEVRDVSYHFTDEKQIEAFSSQGKLIESRTYNTVYGPWTYATIDDGQIDLNKRDYLIPGTLESFGRLKEYFGEEQVVPIYIEVEDGERLIRAIRREMMEAKPKYAEVCRRFIADSADFSEDNIKQAGISKRYSNNNIAECTDSIIRDIVRG
ncbi:MAG: guanylate kinase [Eubacteriales bacterium]|nr:guanylate kinase [Eubacteriales bacterium]